MDTTRGYLTAKGRRNVHKFQYKGGDTSLWYKYFLSPLAQKGVDFTPTWVAPNLITTIGLVAVIISHVVLAWYNPDFDQSEPWWPYIFCGVCLAFYQTLDNMDGKQARKTGSSSPLGLLFDHGCDAVNAGMLSATSFACALQCGPSFWSFALWMTVTLPFYWASWEEFHLDEFILPIINGPSEGITLTVLIYLATGIWGPGIWHAPSPVPGFELWQLNITIGLVAAVCTCVYQTIKVVRQQSAAGKGVMPCLLRAAPVVYLCVLGSAWCLLSEDMLHHHSRLLHLTLGAAFSDAVMKLMLAHVCQQKYYPNIIGLASLMLGPLNAVFGVVDEAALLWVMLAVHFSLLTWFSFKAVAELKDALGVQCFTIPDISKPNVAQRMAKAAAERKKAADAASKKE